MKATRFLLLFLVFLLCNSCQPDLEIVSTSARTLDAVALCAFDANTVVQSLGPLNQAGTGPFNAATYGNCDPSVDPHCVTKYGPTTGGPQLNSSWVQAIQNTYNLAPPTFKAQLCTLKYIYIDNNASSPNVYAWGMRERGAGNIRHIGLPARLFSSSSYSQYETDTLNRLLGAAPGTTSVTATPDSLELKLLAILSHEMAHILWWHGGIANKSCGTKGNFFKSWASWDRNPAHGFHQFGVQLPGNIPIERFTYNDVVQHASVGDYGYLRTIYSDKNWASLFAIVAPDEDFVETYKLGLMLTQLTSLTVSVPGLQTDIASVARDSNSTLFTKVDWASSCP